MKRKMVVALVLSVAMLALAGCGKAPADTSLAEGKTVESDGAGEKTYEKPEVVLRYGELNPDTHPMTMAAREFARIVAEKSNGRMAIEIYPSGQLGDEKTQVQSVQMGALDMFRAGSSFLSDYGIEMMRVFELPYIFRDVDHSWSVLDSDIGDEFLQAVTDSGTKMVGIGYFADSPRNYFFTNKKVTSVSEMKNLKIRVPQSEMHMETANAFGASATPISYSELYSALQTGVVDGAENALTAYEANKFYEVAKYYTFDAHSLAPYILVFSEISWNKLDENDQEFLSDCWSETEKWYREVASDMDAQARVNLEASGVEFFEVDNKQEWVDAVAPLYEKFGAGYEDVIRRIQETK
ncbi:TRAP transporter substrate-binding protein [Anaerotalea alkaliphila]|uniref:TRAP transporter substrate-binding protein n=1 Tax=Anaerotalea alkaliphila TaxID=2662126 RepID=A0A7X5HXM5_9FIRM|nr:TRAP transporter substrate-binding protein [Anaerotalea alkaliphila]NDL68547.1 TRAP transporter substrate-binding protein [Anaerotalea alkaliphila]